MAITRRGSDKDNEAGVNLTPVMSILVILVPMLLYSFTFFEVGIQSVSAPRSGGPRATKERPLNLTVLATHKGFVVKANPALLDQGAVVPLGDAAAADERGYDYASLYARLIDIKKRFPAEERIHIGAEPDVPWYVVARTLDTARVMLKQDRYDSELAYADATPRLDAGGNPVGLFPQASFVVAE